MAVHINKRSSRWMQTARRFSWVLAFCMILNQSLILFESHAKCGNSPDLFSMGIAVLPSQAPSGTLNKLNSRNIFPTLDRAPALLECPLFSKICVLQSDTIFQTSPNASLIFHKTELHLRV
ncbi:MAG: hypothetical protein WCU00_00805 [Candidatus Latescibacterota bacterium]